jgi:hypothetical protein
MNDGQYKEMISSDRLTRLDSMGLAFRWRRWCCSQTSRAPYQFSAANCAMKHQMSIWYIPAIVSTWLISANWMKLWNNTYISTVFNGDPMRSRSVEPPSSVNIHRTFLHSWRWMAGTCSRWRPSWAWSSLCRPARTGVCYNLQSPFFCDLVCCHHWITNITQGMQMGACPFKKST